jgi:hypothetical protein
MLDIEELKKIKLKPYSEQSIEHKAADPGALAMLGQYLLHYRIKRPNRNLYETLELI